MTPIKPQPSLDSPCIRNCCLDGEDFCMGCGRHLQDILQWQQANNSERAAILARASARRKQFPSSPKRN